MNESHHSLNNNFHDRFIKGNYDLSKEQFQEYVDNQKRHIKPLPFIQKRINEYFNKYDFENSIGLHIRRTDLKEQEKN